ncbi:gastrula zinc finger protein XlCGF57.1-like isoform X12 [Achroia grisella]|uniref:gastrula zinc finger protein XlCGF57.1-like isoform X12 n=1 Tax=Achroia grisella TaxID=688607 RepID=UPI0027D301ED|nr:gastrula zinc finger protein XlCGF57.1-like isoform X12 [Achroia grisella]
MAAKTMEWRPGPTVCRCCLAEGCYKDISTEYFWMGKREVYSEMLSETFSVSIAYSTAGGPNSNSRLICEPCISRLRDASDFKRQVQECERTFMQHLDPGSTSTAGCELTVEPEDVKIETVKLEAHLSDVDVDDGPDFGDDDDDDLDDEPLTKFATKVPKKESVDLLDLIDNSKAAEKRKSTTKVKATPAKKTKKETVKPTSSKPKPEKKKKELNLSPMALARRNAQIIVGYSTAYPFKLPECSMVCVYCLESFDDPAQFRKHMDDEHQEVKIRIAFAHIPDGYIKVDITDLRCRLCRHTFEELEPLADHLISAHDLKMEKKYDLGVQPFKFVGGRRSCALCGEKFATLRALSRHTQSHYLKHTCESCGKSYFTSSSLQQHMKLSHIGDQRICVKCKKTFMTLEAKRKHLNDSPKCWSFLCRDCGERFMTATQRDAHRAQLHGAQKKTYHCLECNEVFPDRMRYRVHYKITHTDQYFTCSCGRKFDTKTNLEKHRVVHTKEKLFPCTVCMKSFARKRNLVQHMWIHSEHKRFSCKICNKQFTQNVTWKSHMRTYHADMVFAANK